jgi:hypothetical protein
MTRAQHARECAGFTPDEAASRLRVSADYLRRCEGAGFPFSLACRAARLYDAPLGLFLNTRKGV